MTDIFTLSNILYVLATFTGSLVVFALVAVHHVDDGTGALIMFYVGQKVVCINDSDACCVVKGTVYSVDAVFMYDGKLFLNIDGPNLCRVSRRAMWAARFRPVVERKTDIAIFTAMLNPSKVDA